MVKCAECGFLANRATDAHSLVSSSPEYRNDGSPIRSEQFLWNRPDCAAGEVDFTTILNPNPTPPDLLEVIHAERECRGFVAWRQGLSPQEHHEVKAREVREAFENEVRERRDKFEAALQEQQLRFQAAAESRQNAREDARDHAMREREDKRDAEAQLRYDEQMGTLRSNHRRELFVYGLVLALATVFAGMMQAGWTPEPGWLEHPGWWWPFR